MILYSSFLDETHFSFIVILHCYGEFVFNDLQAIVINHYLTNLFFE